MDRLPWAPLGLVLGGTSKVFSFSGCVPLKMFAEDPKVIHFPKRKPHLAWQIKVVLRNSTRRPVARYSRGFSTKEEAEARIESFVEGILPRKRAKAGPAVAESKAAESADDGASQSESSEPGAESESAAPPSPLRPTVTTRTLRLRLQSLPLQSASTMC